MSGLTRTRGLQHDALFFSDEQMLASAIVPFIREGLDRREVVFLGCSGHPVFPLLGALFGDEPGVRFVDLGRPTRPVTVIDYYQRAMDAELRQGVTGFRAVGFVEFQDVGAHWVESLRYEAALNLVFTSYPLSTMCLWDLRRLPDGHAPAYRAAHPGIFGPTGRRPNEEYVEPDELVRRPEYQPQPDPAQAGPPDFEADVGEDLRPLRMELYPLALSSHMSSEKVDDFIKAVGGVVLNACVHGTGTARLRLWAQPQKLVCTITDRGPGIDDPFLGYAKPAAVRPGEESGSAGGFGMWAARQLCDSLDYASEADGFTVRLVSRD